jgi:phytoene dehydrogenase-like protein
MRQPSVLVMGGGVAGMSAAHELADRGFRVTVLERRAIPGGKARSVPVPHTGTAGRRDLPGEHGFRFFPGFYRHLPDTMRRIPLPGRPNGVFDNLVPATRLEMARAGMRKVVIPARFPTSL